MNAPEVRPDLRGFQISWWSPAFTRPVNACQSADAKTSRAVLVLRVTNRDRGGLAARDLDTGAAVGGTGTGLTPAHTAWLHVVAASSKSARGGPGQTVYMTADDQEGPYTNWAVKLRLAIDAGSADEAQAIAEEVWRKMGVTAGSEPEITRSAGRAPYWNIITDLDLSGVESIPPEGALIRFRYVTRNLPGVLFIGTSTGGPRTGLWQWLWQWLPDSWELAGQRQELAHPAVRAAGIRISVLVRKKRMPGLSMDR